MEDGKRNLQEAFAKAGKRAPSQSPEKAKLEKIKRMAEKVQASSSTPGAASSGDEGNLAILQAIGALSDKMDKMALKSDLEELTVSLRKEIKTSVSEAVDPIQDLVHELGVRVRNLEDNPPSASPPSSSTTPAFKELLNTVNRLDPAFRRVAFVGWPEGVSEDTRIQEMEKFLKTHFSSFRPVGFGNDFTGPYNNQKLSKGSWVEFCSPDMAKSFLSRVQRSGFQGCS